MKLLRGMGINMDKQRHCIICDTTKHEALFEKCGEHIIPQSLGNRNFVTHRVCKDCNGGLGGTVDAAIKKEFKVGQVRFDRNVSMKQKNPFLSRNVTGANVGEFYLMAKKRNPLDRIWLEMAIVKDEVAFHKNFGDSPILLGGTGDNGEDFYFKLDYTDFNPQSKVDIQGAVLKIAYEATHFHLEKLMPLIGDMWMQRWLAHEIRDVLHAYATKNITRAHKLIKQARRLILQCDADRFYGWLGTPRHEIVRIATENNCCVNGLWLCPLSRECGFSSSKGLGMVFDIEGLPIGYVVLDRRHHGISQPTQVFPEICNANYK